MSLVHYIFVRRDLPIGTIAAMVTHAAGESAAKYESKQDNIFNEPIFNGATAVVLEAKDEKHLNWIADYLFSLSIDFTEVHESGGPYSGQFMAIGVVPAEREAVSEKMRDFQTLKDCQVKSKVDPMIKIAGLEDYVDNDYWGV